MFSSLRQRLPRIGRLPRLLAAAVCLLLAASSALHASEPRTRRQLVDVVAAAHDMPAGHLLRASDLRVSRWPATLRPVGARADPAGLAGQRLAGPVRAGEPLGDTRLVGAGLTRGLPRGEVAAPVLLDDPHAADVVHAGDRVTLFETPRPLDATIPEQPPPESRIASLAEHALVLAVLPGSTDDAPGELVLAVDESTAIRLTRDRPTQMFTFVVDPA